MHVIRDSSTAFDEALVVAPDTRGGVAWSQFNTAYERLQTVPWFRINEGRSYPLAYRMTRLVMAWFVQRTGAILDLKRKARILHSLPIPRDPDIIFFGAEVGWEAALIQALFGDRGRVVLIDSDESAYQRFLNAPRELTVRAPRGFPTRTLTLRRNLEEVEYIRQDFFDWSCTDAFDVGIDWGLIEHFPGDRKLEVLRRFQSFLRPDGLQVSAVPRQTLSMRSFYWAFRDELNFGYRELLTPREHADTLARSGFRVVRKVATPTTALAACRRGD